MDTKVVNLRLEACDVKICRGTLFGNPYEIGVDGTREEVIARYHSKWFPMLLKDPVFYQELLKLKGKRLGCFCKQPHIEVPCHGDGIVKWLNQNA